MISKASGAFIVTAAAASWLAMMTVHEFGHVLAAWVTGGHVANVVLHPLAISRTDLTANPQPVAVSLSGPVVGSMLPAALWLVTRAARTPHACLCRFFSGFCLVANGVYLGSALGVPVGDAEDLLRMGVPRWPLGSAGAAAAVSGLVLWNRTGAMFGLDGHPVDRTSFRVALIALGVLAGGMLVWSSMTRPANPPGVLDRPSRPHTMSVDRARSSVG